MKAHERIEWVIAYGLTLVSALTASLYGFMSAAGPYGYVKGAGLFGVAFIGCHGPAWIMKAKERVGWAGALFGGFVTLICLAATLWGGLGTNASGGAALRAERTKVSSDIADDRAALKKIEQDRTALPAFTPTNAEAVAAARAAVAGAERNRIAECGNGDPKQRGPNCRARETSEQEKRDALAAAMNNKAATDAAAKLDNDAASIQKRLANAAPIVDADPQASAFSQLTGIPVALSAALNAFWLSLAFELGAMFTMLIAYSNARPASSQPPTTAPIPDIAPGGNVVSIESARVPGDPGKFALARLAPAPGKSIAIAELHEPYQRWCSDEGCRALGREEFAAQFAQLCEFAGVRKRTVRGKVLCLGLALSA